MDVATTAPNLSQPSLWSSIREAIRGSHQDFTPDELRRRYGSPQNYVARVTEVARKAESEGFLLKSDADRTIREAREVSF